MEIIYPDCDMNRWCCAPSSIIANADNYYTKSEIDEIIEDVESGGTCCITEDEVDAKIASAITVIEGEIPSLEGYATEEWVANRGYITGVDLSNYATLEDIPDLTNYALKSEIPSLDGYATESYVSAYTYDKATIDEKVAGGGTFDPTQYYTSSETDGLLADKQDTLSAGSGISIDENNVISVTGTAITVDDALDSGSTNPVQNKVIAEALDEVENTIETKITNHFVCLTQAEYDAIGTKQNNVLYLIHE